MLKTGTKVHSDVRPERKPEQGYIRMLSWNETRNEGTFAKTTLLRNRPSISQQGGSGTEPEPETGTDGTVFFRNRSRNRNVGTVFQEPKPEPEPCLSATPVLIEKSHSRDEPLEPRTGTARTVPFTNRNRTEPNRDHPVPVKTKKLAKSPYFGN